MGSGYCAVSRCLTGANLYSNTLVPYLIEEALELFTDLCTSGQRLPSSSLVLSRPSHTMLLFFMESRQKVMVENITQEVAVTSIHSLTHTAIVRASTHPTELETQLLAWCTVALNIRP